MDDSLLMELKDLVKTIDRRMFAIAKMNESMQSPNPLQSRILEYLINHQDIVVYAKDLETSLNVSKGAISTALNSMEKNNYIKRTVYEYDARNKIVSLTDQSIKTFNDFLNLTKTIDSEIMSGISKEESEEFHRIVLKMMNNLKGEMNVRNTQDKEELS